MISVIIPTYNRAGTILRSVNSVLNQTYKDLELIIIDDGSTDNTKKLIEEMEDDRIRYIYLGANGGASNARNIGASYALGDWIAFQDSDDAWRPEKLEKQMILANEHPEYSLIYSSFEYHDLDGTSTGFPARPYTGIMENDMYSSLLLCNVIGCPTMLIKRDAFSQSGGFDTNYHSLEDWEFVIRFSKNNLIGFVPDYLMDVYLLNNGVSSRVAPYYESRCRMLAEYREDIMKLGLFDTIVLDIFNRAKDSGVQKQVQDMMMLYLQTISPKNI
ncbi:MAG: glycosyltransferase [Lachnospiraceae bacterium]|nr:glycosyltransferase [Lachnospiraceae bacterium]